MTLTIPTIPEQLLAQIKKRAAAQGKTLQEVALDALARGLETGVDSGNARRDLSDIAGTMSDDDARAIDEVVRQMDAADIAAKT